MHVPMSRPLIPLGIVVVAAGFLAFGVINLTNFLWVMGTQVAASAILFMVALVGSKNDKRKQHEDTSR